MSEPRPLGSTYRLQLAGIGFRGATELVGYLSDLGIETLYLSPILRAVAGSSHGYDVIDPTQLDPALGSFEDFESLLAELAAHDMRALIDIVPNHMACDRSNEWWWDTLRLGQDASAADTFDIDWSRHDGKVMVATLSAPLDDLLGTVLFRGDGPKRTMHLGGSEFPLSPGTRTSEVRTILAHQHYRPAFWRLSDREGNYRRFFDIDGLIGVRVEDPDVFSRTHDYLATLGNDERIAGWRVDHIDGLFNPREYLERLAAFARSHRERRTLTLVEKILALDEDLPSDWSADGTTGYDFATRVVGLMVDERGARRLASAPSFFELGLAAKRDVLNSAFDAARERLVRLAVAALNETHSGHDLSWFDVRAALSEITVSMDVYRTYVADARINPPDCERLARAARRARDSLHGESRRAAQLLGDTLSAPRGTALELICRWQQLTPGVMAKGVEDTATYRYQGLLAQADVGADPDHPSCEPKEYHRFAVARLAHPNTLNATSTHDSKRSEDARARLATLSEVPERWEGLIRGWHRRYFSPLHVEPDDEARIYQGFVCLWPSDAQRAPRGTIRRIQAYCVKAAREAKVATSWTNSDNRYERGVRHVVSQLALDERFVREIGRLMADIAPATTVNSLSSVVLKCLSPGVPDFYQGTETFNFTLTDPDNRRPVNFTTRQRALASLNRSSDTPSSDLRAMLAQGDRGPLKIHLTRTLLHLRRQYPDLFVYGDYLPLSVSGPLSAHLIAFARSHGDQWVLGCVPRLALTLAGPGRLPIGRDVWKNTAVRLPRGAPRHFVDSVTAAELDVSANRLAIAEIFSDLPVGVLTGATN
ncbi:MAG: malto-oligosyltrehalose synthase [Acidimicrobiales bacterium]